ncbi:MAG: hypothetical protein KBE65_16765 [Phycisphaerae bacterium]|nr:hypothetical protein [Phycisphaerae bacterium]
MTHLRRRKILAAVSVAAFLAIGYLVWRLWSSPALYRMTILPSLGGRYTEPYSLNDLGQVVGMEQVSTADQRIFLWDRRTGIQDLGRATGDPLIINNAGQVAGTMMVDPNHREAFLWEPGRGRTMLGTLGGRMSIAEAMNNHGQIIGLSQNAPGSLRAFLWDGETGMRELTAPDGSRCDPVSINDAGQILVMAFKKPRVMPGPWFLLDPNGSRPLDTIPADAWLTSINTGSCMIGVERASGTLPCLLLGDGQGTWRRLSPMNSHGNMTRLNDRNQIAFTEFTRSRWKDLRDRLFRPRFPRDETASYLWDPARGRISLDRYVRGMDQFLVVDLNNEGCIVGIAETEDGSTRSVLLEPIPERWGK